MLLIYNVLQGVFLVVFSPIIIIKVLLTPKYRRRIWERLGFGVPSLPAGSSRPRIWVHALSVGEVISSVAFIEEMRRQFPDAAIVLSTSTATGAATAHQKLGDTVNLLITYPLDLLWSVRRVISRVRPDVFLLVETDLWPNLLSELSRQGKPVILLNGRISDASHKRYKKLRFFFAPVFSRISYFAMQSAHDEMKLVDLGVDSTRVWTIGNLKFDQAGGEISQQGIETLRDALRIAPERRVFVAGSTHKGEEEIVLAAYGKVLRACPDLFLLLAPRDPKRADAVKRLSKDAGLEICKKTELPTLPRDVRLHGLVLDTIGELSRLYALASAAFVGGSLVNERGHNVLEVAAHAKPVLFGPHTEDFRDATAALLERDGGDLVHDADELAASLTAILTDPDLARRKGEVAFQLVKENRGSVAKAIDLVASVLGDDFLARS